MSSAASLVQKLTSPKLTAAERLNQVEQQIGQLDENDRNLAETVNNLDRVVEAMVELYGAQEIGEKMIEIRRRKMEEGADAHQAAFDKAVEEGKLAKVETSQKSDLVVVTQQKNGDGEVLYPTRVFLPLPAYTPDAQKMLGFEGGKLTRELKVGEVLEMAGLKEGDPMRGSLTILALYEPVAKAKAETVAPADQATAAPAAVEAPAVDTSGAPALPTETA
jgi:hypothetical protein